MVFLENVKNLSVHDKGKTLITIVAALQKNGYDVVWRVLNASHYGVPQKRERIYILGFDKTHRFEYSWPATIKTTKRVRDVLQRKDHADVQALRIDEKRYKPKINVLTPVKPGTDKPVRIGSVGLGRQGERIYHIDAHAVTLSASGGGVGAKTGMYYADKVVRRLTPRECARLNGFPEVFRHHDRTTEALKQFGNSVVVDVIQHIMRPTQKLFDA
jgi:DNA (cytosine-5)-methyltransferase 1